MDVVVNYNVQAAVSFGKWMLNTIVQVIIDHSPLVVVSSELESAKFCHQPLFATQSTLHRSSLIVPYSLPTASSFCVA